MSKIKSREEYQKCTLEAVDLYNRHEYKKALPMFVELADYNQKNIKIHELLSYIYLQLNEVAKADKEYKIVCQLMREKFPQMSEPLTFDQLVGKIGAERDKLEANIKEVLESTSGQGEEPKRSALLAQARMPIHLAILLMADGEYKKAEEMLKGYVQRCDAAAS